MDSLEFLKEEMESDEISVRVNAVHRISVVAALLGVDAFKNFLFPFIES